MTIPTPLDIAGHLSVMRRTLENVLDRTQVDRILDSVAAYAGVSDTSALAVRQEQGLSVYGVISPYPQGTQSDLDEVIQQIIDLSLLEADVLRGSKIATGEDWTIPEAAIASTEELKTLTIDALHYSPPFVG